MADTEFKWVVMGYHVTIKDGMASFEPFFGAIHQGELFEVNSEGVRWVESS